MNPIRRKICVVTGTRAEYGLLRWVMQGIQVSKVLDLQLIVTGMHLSPEFGFTLQDIEADGFSIDRKVEMLLSSDTPVGITKSMGLGMIGFADALSDLEPDLVLVLGDRFEIFAACSAAMVARIPIAHCHGGEATEGVIDESIRHSISKMSHLHFVATEDYRRRVIQLGEQPYNVFNVGGLGIDSITHLKLLPQKELEDSLGLKFSHKNLLITYHPVTLEKDSSLVHINELLECLATMEETTLIFTMPNADTDGRIIAERVAEFCKKNKNAYAFTSLGQLRYLSCLKYVDAVLGNSSSGLHEAPTFKKGTINIGDRQLGRIRASSVIDCAPNQDDIKKALERLYTNQFQESLLKVKNPYGDGGASEKIVRILEEVSLEFILKKSFCDLF